MTKHILALKSKLGAASQLEAAKKAAESGKKGGSDSRFWKPFFDKEKQYGSAVIRLLPSIEEDHLDWAFMYHHSFKGSTGKWYIENCLTTIGKEDPVANLARRLWNSGIDSDKKVSSMLKRKKTYTVNVLVVKDPANAENEGKVFLWRFGQQIFDIIDEAMSPKDESEEAIMVFNPFLGADFKLKMSGKDVNGDIVPNYERSVFTTPSPIADDDDEVIEICSKAHKLSEFDAPSNFKEYDELKRLLFEVLGPVAGSGLPTIEGWEGAAVSTPAQKEDVPRTVTKRKAESVDDDDKDPPFDADDTALDSVMNSTSGVVKKATNSDLDPELAKLLMA